MVRMNRSRNFCSLLVLANNVRMRVRTFRIHVGFLELFEKITNIRYEVGLLSRFQRLLELCI